MLVNPRIPFTPFGRSESLGLLLTICHYSTAPVRPRPPAIDQGDRGMVHVRLGELRLLTRVHWDALPRHPF